MTPVTYEGSRIWSQQVACALEIRLLYSKLKDCPFLPRCESPFVSDSGNGLESRDVRDFAVFAVPSRTCAHVKPGLQVVPALVRSHRSVFR